MTWFFGWLWFWVFYVCFGLGFFFWWAAFYFCAIEFHVPPKAICNCPQSSQHGDSSGSTNTRIYQRIKRKLKRALVVQSSVPQARGRSQKSQKEVPAQPHSRKNSRGKGSSVRSSSCSAHLLHAGFRHLLPGSELLRDGSLKQQTWFLFRLLLFHWCFSIYLSDQVIKDLQMKNTSWKTK